MFGPPEDQKLISVSHDTALKTGDQLKMFVQLQKRCFVYVIYCDTQNEINMLFPTDPDPAKYRIREKYYIPPGDSWFTLDEHTGKETFYLLASVQRLFDLEVLYERYSSSTPRTKQRLANQILAKIKEIKKKHRTLTVVAERPVRLGGTLRSTGKKKSQALPKIDSIAVEISADQFYSRTFTIDHR
jgi:hypothetical protein